MANLVKLVASFFKSGHGLTSVFPPLNTLRDSPFGCATTGQKDTTKQLFTIAP